MCCPCGCRRACRDRRLRAAIREAGRDVASKTGEAADKTIAVVGDAAITSAVKATFLADPTVKVMRIDVDTDAGVVTLHGTVSTRGEAD